MRVIEVVHEPVEVDLSRRIPVVMALGLLLALMAPHAQAQGMTGPEPESWTGGNGWCSGDVCFRAWPEPGGVEIRWLVQSASASLVVTRMQLQPAVDAGPLPVAQSECLGDDCVGEFSYFDAEVIPGALYQYELVREQDLTPLGDPLEAGIAVQAVDPGGSHQFEVYLPLTLSH